MNEEYILKKVIDWSLLNRGVAIPVEMQTVFSLHLSGGYLNHGEKRTVKIILNDETHEVTLTSVNSIRKIIPTIKICGKLFTRKTAHLQMRLKIFL